MVTRILVAESRAQVRETIRTLLLGLGCHPVETGDVETALRCLDRDRPALTIVGCIGGAGADAGSASLDLVRRLRSRRPGLPLLFFAADSTEALAIDALKAGVTDYIKQPCFHELAQAIARWVGATPAVSPDQEELLAGPPIAGAGAALVRVRQYLRKVAAADCTVLITGETGTGKELAAQAIHANSARRSKPFVTINCAAIPDELVESELFGFERGAFTGAHTSNAGRLMQADGGTAFLDEIGELNAHAQAKMLRVIENKELQRLGASQNRPVDIRIIAATNQDLGQMVELNQFRRDLYFRLNVAHLRLPPLRERREDIPLLTDLFLRELNRRMCRQVEGLTPEAMDLLMRHSWPGNVRELKNLLEGLLVDTSAGWIRSENLPAIFFHPGGDGLGAAGDERTIVLRALQATRWNKSKAAEKLNWSRMTLYRKMAKYEIVSRSRKSTRGPAAAAAGD